MACRVPRAVCLAVIVLTMVTACSETVTLPPTYPVKGMVVRANGQPLTGGLVSLRCAEEPNLITEGVINGDGTFELVTVYKNVRQAGAIVGEHEVMVIPPMSIHQEAAPETLATKVTIEAKDLNELKLQMTR